MDDKNIYDVVYSSGKDNNNDTYNFQEPHVKTKKKRGFNKTIAGVIVCTLCSGFIGILIARILIFPVNIIIKNLSSLDNVARLNPLHALILILISILLTLIGGLIPAKIASKKDPVVALRSE